MSNIILGERMARRRTCDEMKSMNSVRTPRYCKQIPRRQRFLLRANSHCARINCMAESETSATNRYLSERDRLVEIGIQAQRTTDSWILALSSGAIAISLDLPTSLLPVSGVGFCFLAISWAAFSLALLAAFFSLKQSHKASESYRNNLDRIFKQYKDDWAQHMHDSQIGSNATDLLDKLNNLAPWLVVAGIVGLLFSVSLPR